MADTSLYAPVKTIKTLDKPLFVVQQVLVQENFTLTQRIVWALKKVRADGKSYLSSWTRH